MKKLNGKELLIDLVYVIIGTALVGAALSVFTIPNDIAPGGVSGLATALAYITPIRVRIWTLALNVPLLIGAWRLLGKRSLIFTIKIAIRHFVIELDSISIRYCECRCICPFYLQVFPICLICGKLDFCSIRIVVVDCSETYSHIAKTGGVFECQHVGIASCLISV